MEHESKNNEYKPSPRKVYLAVLVVSLLYINLGCHMAWTSPTYDKLKTILTKSELSWVTSVMGLGAFLSPIITGLIINRIPRKVFLFLIGTIMLAGWIILISSFNFYVLCIGRMFSGFGSSLAYAICSVYATEVSDPERRGMLGAVSTTFVSLGLLIEYCIGPYVSYNLLILISSLSLFVFFPLVFFLPETPQYCLLKGKRDQAEKSLHWLRPGAPSDVIEKELKLIETGLHEGSKDSDAGLFLIFKSRGGRKALFLSSFTLLAPQLAGFNAVIGYAQEIFEQTNVALSSAVSSMIVGADVLISGLFTPILVRKFGTRIMFIVSCIGSSISLGLLVIFFYLEKFGYNLSKVNFLPLFALLMFCALYSWGLGAIAFTLAAEFFPPNAKAMSSFLSGILCVLFNFIIVKCFAVIMDAYGIAVVFLTIFILCFCGTITIIVTLPNTSGLTLEQIHEYLETGIRPKKIDWQSDENKTNKY